MRYAPQPVALCVFFVSETHALNYVVTSVLRPFFTDSAGVVCWLMSALPQKHRRREGSQGSINRIKQGHRVATRYDKLAENHLAFVQLASIRLRLRFMESAP